MYNLINLTVLQFFNSFNSLNYRVENNLDKLINRFSLTIMQNV